MATADEIQELDLLAAFQARFGLGPKSAPDEDDLSSDTNVLNSAHYVYNNAIDVSVNREGVHAAAAAFANVILAASNSAAPGPGPFTTQRWGAHELHPSVEELGEERCVSFIFTLDLMNFSFWAEDDTPQFAVEYRGKLWTGYWSLVAALRRALDEGWRITQSDWWQCEDECNEEALKTIFRSATSSDIPLLAERLECLREAGKVLYEYFDCSALNLVHQARGSAGRLANLLATRFPRFSDEVQWEDEHIRFLKRAQLFAADLWACFEGRGPGQFEDIENLTAFADYRIPQMLHFLGCISYSPPLDAHIRRHGLLEPGHNWEVQLRGCSLWAVELLRREILRILENHRMNVEQSEDSPRSKVNAALIDFYLYDTVKEREAQGEVMVPHHRTRSIWY